MTQITSVPIMVIALLKQWRHRGLSTATQLAGHISSSIPNYYTRSGLESFERMESYIARRLEELRLIGMVSGSPESGYVLIWDTHDSEDSTEITDEVRQPPPAPPDVGRGGGQRGDGEGIGVREVLMHPMLFSVSKTDFEELLLSALGDGSDV